MLKWLWLSAIVIVIDQATKLAADNMLMLYQSIEIIPMFNLTLMYNEGAAFSFLSSAGGWQRWFFIILSSVVSVVLLVWLKRLPPQNRLEAIGLSSILGGAVGNLIDRIAYGHVVDFIDVYYKTHHWPAFNIADSAITIGVVLLIIHSFRKPEDAT